jgi:hypothetical protein
MKSIFIAIASISLLFLPNLVFAQSVTDTNSAPVFHTPGEYGYVNPLGTTNITTIINRVIRTALGFVGALFLAMFIYGGAVWMTAQGDEKRVQTAKTTIRNSVIGMLIIAFSYGIISIIFQASSSVRGTGTFASPTAPPAAPPQSCTTNSDCPALATCQGGVCVDISTR